MPLNKPLLQTTKKIIYEKTLTTLSIYLPLSIFMGLCHLNTVKTFCV